MQIAIDCNAYVSSCHLFAVADREASKKNGKSWDFVPTRGGLTESQLVGEIIQNQICLGTVQKCDETHTTQMGRQYLLLS